MNTPKRQISLGFEHEPLCEGEHICLIYRTEEERRDVVARFLGSGLEAGEKVLALVDTTSLDDFVEIMAENGLELKGKEAETAILQANSVYRPDGSFVPEEMLEKVAAMFEGARAEGFVGWRGTGEMTWAVTGPPTPMDELVRYEAKINNMLEKIPATVFCQYDANKFDGATLMDVLAVHPMMIVGGQLIRNPMYTGVVHSHAGSA